MDFHRMEWQRSVISFGFCCKFTEIPWIKPQKSVIDYRFWRKKILQKLQYLSIYRRPTFIHRIRRHAVTSNYTEP